MKLIRYTGEMISSTPFYTCPKILIHNEYFSKISSDAKLLYMVMQNRVTLSQENNWEDEKGYIYIYLTIEEACEILNCSHMTAKKTINQLKDIGLIESVKQGFNKPNRIYVNAIIKEFQGQLNSSCPDSQNLANGELKISSMDSQNLATRNNNIINNKYRKNDSSSSSIDHHHNQPNFIKEYMIKINPTCSRLELEKLSSYLDDGLEEDLIIEAINEAVLSNVRNYKYIASILNRCLDRGIKTKEQFIADKNIRKGVGNNDRTNKQNNGTTEATEDFFNGKLKEF